MNEPLKGTFFGLASAYNSKWIEDTLFVVQPVSNGPFRESRHFAGDRIIAVNDSGRSFGEDEHEDIS